MDCSIVNHKIQLLLQDTETSFNMLIDTDGRSDMDYVDYTVNARINCFRSALQNPDLRRVELASMLRRALKKQKSIKSQKTYWSAFMTSYVRKNANSNEIFE